MEALVLQLSGSSHASSPPPGSKPAPACHHIPLLSTPASVCGHTATDTGPSSQADVVCNTLENNDQSVTSHSDLSCVLKGQYDRALKLMALT